MLAPAQIHAQQHFGPVLGFRATGSGLDVDEGIRRVHLVREHALEFERAKARFGGIEISDDRRHGFFIVLSLGEREQLSGVVEPAGQVTQGRYDTLEFDTFAAELLGAFRLVPDTRVFEFAIDFYESFRFAIEVKDTP
jgi:hypothetical protein